MGYASAVDEVAGAIADPVRREILLMLRERPLSAGQVADRFAISRPAVSRHLRVLREAGLVDDVAEGRRRVYALVAEPLDELAGWLTQLTAPGGAAPADTTPADATPADTTPAEAGWQRRFDALETEVHRTRRERRVAADRHPDQDRERRTAAENHPHQEKSA
ncbi:metalloregulator ArsR/SmtB family transcription factor [Actinoplanes sp. NPDC089786]|uniref:metalloregulator ArsR/SmtB family transcription factor n=1 Tax=Actinoplanes sp. NPDC089786 TaxID=3155185 RepID=UPI0034201588